MKTVVVRKEKKSKKLKINPKSYHGERQDHFMISC